jgi:hypothetical protein
MVGELHHTPLKYICLFSGCILTFTGNLVIDCFVDCARLLIIWNVTSLYILVFFLSHRSYKKKL